MLDSPLAGCGIFFNSTQINSRGREFKSYNQIYRSAMETLAEKNRDQKESTVAFKPGGPHIQIDSISIEISSGEMNENLEECKHFSIRGFVSEVRKKDSTLCSPFLSDGDVNNSDVPAFELPPLEFRKFRWWRCSGCLQDCNSSQGTSKEVTAGKRMPSQNSGKQRCQHDDGCSKGLSKLFARAAADGSPTSSQRSAKGKQVQEGGSLHEMSKDIERDPLCYCGNSQGTLLQKLAKGKRLLQDGYSQEPSKENNVVPFSVFPNSRGASFLKSVNEAVMVPFNGLNFEKVTSSRKSEKELHLQKGSSSRGMPKVVMGPPGGFATSSKSSKEQNLLKSGYSQGTSKEFAMPPPGGFSYSRQSSLKSGKGSRLQHHSSSRGAPPKDASMLPLFGYPSGKNTCAVKLSKQQNVQNPKLNAQIWQKGETSTAVTLSKKRNYAKRSVQQPENVGDEHEIYKGNENSAIDSNREILKHCAAKEDVLLMPERFTSDKAPLQLPRNEEVASFNNSVEQVVRTSDSAGPSLFQCHQFVKDISNGDSYLHEDGADKTTISVRSSSNRLFKKPVIDDGLEAGRTSLYEEEEEEDYRGLRLKRVPKIRLLSDVIAKYPTNIREQLDNAKASPGASNDISPVRGVSGKCSEQSSKRKVSPLGSYDTSFEIGVSDKAGDQQSSKTKAPPVGSHDTPPGRVASVSASSKKRKRNPLDDEEHLPDSLSGGSKRNSIRFAEPVNKVVHTSQCRPGVDVYGEAIFVADAKKQSKQILNGTEVEKKSKKARVQHIASSSVLPQPRQESRDNCERALASDRCSSGEATVSKPLHGGVVTNGGMDKSLKNIFSAEKVERVHGCSKKTSSPKIGEGFQTATKVLQFGLDNAPDDTTSDCIIIGSGLSRRNDVVENFENSSTPLSSSVSEHQPSVLIGNESRIPQLQAGRTLLVHKGGEGSSCAQQKGNTAEPKGRVKDIDINSIPVDDKPPEQGSADDIPMDIVELLAKHQHERRCDATREKLSLLDSAAQKSFPSMLKPQASYANNGFGKQFEVMGHGKQILSDNIETRRKSVLVGYPKDDHFCARFTGYTQTQGHVPGGAQYSSSMGSTAKSWNGNAVPFRPPSRGILQHMPSYSRYQGGLSPAPPLNTQIWPPMMSSRVPLGGLANQGMYSQGSDMLHKGKVNQGTISFNFERATIGNPTSSSPQPWNSRISDYAAGGRQKASDFHPPKVMRTVDLSSNETIPAMQLLNLVQVAGSRSSTPPVNGTTEFLKKLPFDHLDNQYKQYAPGPHFEPYKSTGSSSRHPLYDSEGRTSFIDKPCQCSSALPTAHMFAASAFQNEQTVGKSGGLKNPITFTTHHQRNMCGSSYNPLVGDLCPDKSSTQIYRTDKKRKSIAAGISDVAGHGLPVSGISIVQPIRKPVLDLARHCEERAAVPLNKGEFCVVNRNPAEILDWKEVRNFMIEPEDLRRGKAVPSSSRLVSNAKRPQTILKGKVRERLHKS